MVRCDACGYRKERTIKYGKAVVCYDCRPKVEEAINTNFTKRLMVIGVARDLLRKDGTSYVIKDIPKSLFQRFRSKAVRKGVTVRDSILNYFEDEIAKED
mgnify:CR=1 FL=1|jgi:hypothetical protein|tara:strand:+ start:762 stop:1061 length:300 start_codon:yes stop_codon:yes gene_type:complete